MKYAALKIPNYPNIVPCGYEIYTVAEARSIISPYCSLEKKIH